MIFLGCALFWMEMLAHAVLRVISLVHITILPLTALALSPSLFSLQNGNTALAIARRLGYISVVDTLKVVTEEITTTTTVSCRYIKMSLFFIQNVFFLFFPQTLHVSLSFFSFSGFSPPFLLDFCRNATVLSVYLLSMWKCVQHNRLP